MWRNRSSELKRAQRKATLFAALFAVFWAVPLLWIAVGSVNSTAAISTGNAFVPSDPTSENWTLLVDPEGRAVNIFEAFFNSTVVSVFATVAALAVCSLGAFALARLPFRGNRAVLIVLLGTMLIPHEVVLVPLFQQFNQLGLLNTYGALALPHVVSVLGIVLLRQFMLAVPGELLEAARVDGANAWHTYRYVVLPLVKPGLATLGVFVFLGAWNDFLWPLIATSTPSMQTLPLALITFRSAYGDTEYGVVMASTVLAITPPLLVFVFAQRFIIQGITRTGLKG